MPDVQAARRVGAAVTTRAQASCRVVQPIGLRHRRRRDQRQVHDHRHDRLDSVPCRKKPDDRERRGDEELHLCGFHVRRRRIGDGEEFVCEIDESDGSIANFAPRIAVVNNISLDHKPIQELRILFRDFANKGQTAVLNLDNAETAALLPDLKSGQTITWSLCDPRADLLAGPPVCSRSTIAFPVKMRTTGQAVDVKLNVPGMHNVANALAALAAASACGVNLEEAAKHLETFAGIRRRLEVVGTANEITVIDDFAHNPEKVSATLETVHAFPGRLLLMFQPHGYGPLRLMRDSLVDCFARGLRDEDVLLMPEPVYFGGTVDRSIGSSDIVKDIVHRGRNALALPDRNACGEKLVQLATAAIASWSWAPGTIPFPILPRTCLRAFSKLDLTLPAAANLGVSINRLLKSIFGDHGARARLRARSYILHARSS